MKQLDKNKALVLFSGGQDSTTCLYWALDRFKEVRALSFDYGQKHRIELECAKEIANLAGIKHEILPLSMLKELGGNSLTSKMEIGSGDQDQLPDSFVPGRNLLFLTGLATKAYQWGAMHLVTGVCQTDYSGYPDCRDDTIKSLQVCLNLGMETNFVIHTPLMWIDKAQSVEMAMELGAMEALGYSHTCYEGKRPPCGVCPACKLREKGFLEAGVKDPLILK